MTHIHFPLIKHSYKCHSCNKTWRMNISADKATCPYCGTTSAVSVHVSTRNTNELNEARVSRNRVARLIADLIIQGKVDNSLLNEYAEAKNLHQQLEAEKRNTIERVSE
jgi:predicted RNA-binding Zn-ribbon protein involved in translation (DUF1610 family)